jgi:hypothetical protein
VANEAQIEPIYGDPERPDRITAYVDTDSGERVDIADQDSPALFVVTKRHDAKEQEKLWRQRVGIYDGILLRREVLPDERQVFGQIQARVAGSTYRDLDGVVFADMVFERFREAFSDDAKAVKPLLAILAAATGYRLESRDSLKNDKPTLPREAEGIYRIAAPTKPTSSWIETRPVARRIESL